jgi:hypothetical protein
MTHNKRYEAHYDALADARLATAPPPPCTLPPDAWGPQPIEWAKVGARAPVWAWISWPDRAAERTAAWATGWNNLVVIIDFDTPRGTRNVVVWRNAVSHRASR